MANVKINKERCKGCNLCIEVCPKNVLAIDREFNRYGAKPVIVSNPSACTGCSLCAIMCPDLCIELKAE